MAEPLTRSDHAGEAESPLTDAASRLERALARLEASSRRNVADAGAAGADLDLLADLADVRARNRELEGVAAAASEALGHAMAEVRVLLDADATPQGELDLGGPELRLESGEPLAEDATGADEAPRKDLAG